MHKAPVTNRQAFSKGYPSGGSHGIDDRSLFANYPASRTISFNNSKPSTSGTMSVDLNSKFTKTDEAGVLARRTHQNMDDMNQSLFKNYLGLKLKTSHYGPGPLIP